MSDPVPVEKNVASFARALFDGHQNHERLAALAEIAHELDDEAFWLLFRGCYVVSPVLFTFHPVLRDMLTPDRLSAAERYGHHTDAALALWKERLRRRKPVKVYRGGTQQNITGFAWTTKRARAVEFAAFTGSPQPKLTVGRIDPRRIVLTIDDNGRSDILAFPEHVRVESVENLKPSAPPPNAALVNQVEAYGLPIDAIVSNVRTAPARLGVSVEDAIASFKQERDYLCALGFVKRPAFLHDVLARLSEPEQEQEAA